MNDSGKAANGLLRRGSLLLPLAIAVFAIAGTAQAEPVNSYSAAIAPTAATAGSTASYTFTITNGAASAQNLGSANITVPSGFTVTSLGAPATPAGTSWSVTLVSGVIELRAADDGDALNPGQSVSTTMTVTTSCTATSGTWTTVAKQSSKFNGPGFVRVGSDPVLAVSGSCDGGGGGGGGSSVVCTSSSTSCTATDPSGTTTVSTAVPPSGATMALGFTGATTFTCDGKTLPVVGAQATVDPNGYVAPISLTFTWDKSVAPGTGVANFVFCLSKDDGASYFELQGCAKKNPTPPCEVSRSRTGVGDLEIVVLIAPDDPIGSLG